VSRDLLGAEQVTWHSAGLGFCMRTEGVGVDGKVVDFTSSSCQYSLVARQNGSLHLSGSG
jgi:hypothetical protein